MWPVREPIGRVFRALCVPNRNTGLDLPRVPFQGPPTPARRDLTELGARKLLVEGLPPLGALDGRHERRLQSPWDDPRWSVHP